MLESTRRGFLLGSLATGAALYTAPAEATLVRGLPLPVMVKRSERILVLEPVDAVCRYAEIGGRRSIVTDTRTRVHEAWGAGSESELTLRTLGGALEGVGELVHGQPVLQLGVRGVAFLKHGRDADVWWAVGMAQGHFPLSDDSERALLLASRGLPSILKLEASAVQRLVGQRVNDARELVRQARQP